jgi:hypothetical protein
MTKYYHYLFLKKISRISPLKEQERKTTTAGGRGKEILSAYRHQIGQRFPSLMQELSCVPDVRKRKEYAIGELLMGGLGMFLFRQDSRNEINNKRREAGFSKSFERCFGTRLAHGDSIADVLCQLDPDSLEEVKMNLMAGLFEQKFLRKHRLLDKYYPVAVDATGVVSFDHRHCPQCLTRTSKNGQTTYFHYVLEAKLVTSDGLCLSLASEWIENPEGEFEKQDCERKAFARLAAKLKKHYPRLPVCILADGLYPYEGAFDTCQRNGWKYIFVLKDNTLKSVQEDLVIPRRRSPKKSCYHVKDGLRIASQYRFENGLAYKKRQVNWIECVEERTRDMPRERRPAREKDPETHCFGYLTNLEVDGGNVIALAAGGRLRWKIENEGFNTQKRGGYELEHKFCRTSLNGLKNYYTLLQIAHALNQFVERSGVVREQLKTHSKETVKNIWRMLVAYMIFACEQEHFTSRNGNRLSPAPA